MDAEEWDQRYRETTLLWTAGPNQWVEQHTAHLPPGRALDLAAGEGRNAFWLAERGWQVTAVDFSPVGIDKARELATQRDTASASRIRWVVDDVLTYSPDMRYDLVLVIYLHLHAEQRRTAFRNAASAFAPGGTLLVIGHHSDNLTHGVGGPPDPAVLYNQHDIVADLDTLSDLHLTAAGMRERAVTDQPRPALDVVTEFVRSTT